MIVYLAGPLTAKNGFTALDNAQAALDIYRQFVAAGIPAFCSHFAEMLDFQLGYEDWMTFDLNFVAECTHVLMLPRWETSAGARRELAHALALGKPVFFEIDKIFSIYRQEKGLTPAKS